MHKIQFIGRIVPSAVKYSMAMPDLVWKWEEEDIDIKIRIKIGNSIVNAECEVERYSQDHVEEFYKRAYDMTRTCANMVAFASGMGFIVLFETLILPDGQPHEIQFADPDLPPLCTAFRVGLADENNFLSVLRMVAAEPNLFLALNDLVETMIFPHAALVNCGRVLDGIRRMITPPGSGLSRTHEWLAMHSALNISRAYQEWISEKSSGPRHADRSFEPQAVVREVQHRTWTIMNRFLEFRKRGSAQLPVEEFPLLA